MGPFVWWSLSGVYIKHIITHYHKRQQGGILSVNRIMSDCHDKIIFCLHLADYHSIIKGYHRGYWSSKCIIYYAKSDCLYCFSHR